MDRRLGVALLFAMLGEYAVVAGTDADHHEIALRVGVGDVLHRSMDKK